MTFEKIFPYGRKSLKKKKGNFLQKNYLFKNKKLIINKI